VWIGVSLCAIALVIFVAVCGAQNNLDTSFLVFEDVWRLFQGVFFGLAVAFPRAQMRMKALMGFY